MTVNVPLLRQATRADNDPPVFILLASPSYAPWLPDTAYQKVPIGGTGQVLTVQADGSMNWQNSPAGFANPMTTAGDLLYEAAGPVPARLPIGSNGQFLQVVGGLPAWAAFVGLTNPMTTAGDLIDGGALGAPQRIAVGSTGQVLTVVSGAPAWATPVTGFANPMTTLGDLITGASGGAAQRLAVGPNGSVLVVSAGTPGWAAASTVGFVNPMTTTQDLIVGGTAGAAQRLAVGANGQVLGITTGTVGWINNPAGFTNPMTTPQDLIVGGAGGAATRLGVGTSGQVLSVSGGAVQWAVPPTPGYLWVTPSGDTTGVKDTAAIQPALTAGTPVFLAPGTFYVGAIGSTSPALTMSTNAAPVTGSLVGWSSRATILKCVNNGTGIYAHGADAGGATIEGNSVNIRGLTVDGSLVGASATVSGIDFGDFYGITLEDVVVQNWTSTGSTSSIGNNPLGAVGFNWNNQFTLTEKCFLRRCTANNCGTPNLTSTPPSQAGGAALQVLSEPGASTSHMYSDIDLQVNTQPGQNALVIARQGHLMNGRLVMRGNMGCPVSGNNGAAVIVIGVANAGGGSAQAGHIQRMFLDVHVELDNGTGGTTMPFSVYSALNADNTVNKCHGRMQFLGNASGGFQFSNLPTANGTFEFSGPLIGLAGDTSLTVPPTLGTPASPWSVTYNGIDALMAWAVSGGSITSVVVNGTTQANVNGPVMVYAGTTLVFTFTGTLTYSLTRASQGG